LHEKIHELANRVRELEDALRADHSRLTTEQHPLLAEELLKIKTPLQREPSANNGNFKPEEENNPDVVDAFGSLSISLSGKAKYFGQIANSWVCPMLFRSRSTPDSLSKAISAGLLGSHSMPFAPILTRCHVFKR